jgi:SAM-dependent methyltransferase
MPTADGYVTDVDYIPGFYPQLAPTALRHVAALNRLCPPATREGFRYLELGCGLGRSLTTLAAANPQGQFTGVDINERHTAKIAADVAAGGLENVRVITADFGSLPDDIGSFDFITMHGVWSWVSPRVRQDVLAIAERKLAPGGLFLVSYNAMPGWAHLQPIKGILQQYAALRTGDSHQRIRDALAYLVFIRDKQAKYFEDNPRAAAYVDALLKQDISYLAHEYLNEHWTTFYFAEVAAAFRGAGLQFAGSLPIHTNFWDLCVKPEFQELFRTTSDRLVAEAHKDFCANTAFRWDIYAKGPRPLATAEDRLREVDDLCYGLVRRDLTLPYRANLGVVTSTVQGPLYQAFIEALQDGSRHLSELLPAVAHAAGGADRKPEEVIRAADAGVAMGMFEVTSGPVPVAAAEAPAAVAVPQPFNRLVLETGALAGRPVALASTCTGSGLQIGDLEAAMLLELSERGRDGLTDRVVTRLVASKRNLQKDGQPVTDEATRNQIVEQACQVFLKGRVPQLVATAVAAPA